MNDLVPKLQKLAVIDFVQVVDGKSLKWVSK